MAFSVNESRLRLTAEDATGRGMASAARRQRELAREAEEAAKRVEAAQRRIASTAGNIGAGLGIGASVAGATRLLKDSYGEFASFDRKLTEIGITAGASGEAMAKAGEKLKLMADEFALPVSTMAEGLDALVASGKSLEEAMEFLPTVARTAQASSAGIREIATSADALSLHLGITGQQMQHAMDILAAGGKAGKFELKDMAQFLPQLAPLAAAIGYKGEEGLKKLVAILQVVRKGTGDAGSAASATMDMFSKMGSEETINKFNSFGGDLKGKLVEWRKEGGDTFGKFVKFTRELLVERAKAEGAHDPLEYLPQLFGDREMQNGMRALLSMPGAVRDLVMSLGKVDGTVFTDLARKQHDALAASQRLSTAFGNLEKAFGKMLSSMKVPEGLTWLAETFEKAAKGAENLSELGVAGSMSRAFNLRAYDGQVQDYRAKQKELEGAKSASDKTRLQKELREMEAQLELTRRRLYESGTAEDRKSLAPDGMPLPPELPGPLSPELRGLAKSPDYSGELNFNNPRGAQEDTLQSIDKRLNEQGNIWRQMFNPTSLSGGNGLRGLIQRASYGTSVDGDGGIVGTGGSGGGGGGGGGGTSRGPGPRGGSVGMPNMRYGPGGRTPGGGSVSGGGNTAPSNEEGRANVASWLSFAQKPVNEGGLGLTKEQAHGMIAGLQGEGGVNLNAGAWNPNDRGMPSGGVAQWRADRLENLKAFARQRGDTANKGLGSTETQQQFLRHEMIGSGGLGGGSERRAYDKIKAAGTRQEALVAHVAGFERPQFPETEARKRAAFLYGHEAGTPGAKGSAKAAADVALSKEGLDENANTDAIRSFIGKDPRGAANAWCADFVNASLKAVGQTGTGSGVATSFLKWGKAVNADIAEKGDVAVEARGRGAGQSGGHVGILTGNRRTNPDTGELELESISGNDNNGVRRGWDAASKLSIRRSTQDPAPGPQSSYDDGARDERAARAKQAMAKSLEGPIYVDVQPRIANAERLRDRTRAQSRREVDREVHQARLNTYSDCGIG